MGQRHPFVTADLIIIGAGGTSQEIAEAIEEQRACWLLSSRPGGLADSIARLEATLAAYA